MGLETRGRSTSGHGGRELENALHVITLAGCLRAAWAANTATISVHQSQESGGMWELMACCMLGAMLALVGVLLGWFLCLRRRVQRETPLEDSSGDEEPMGEISSLPSAFSVLETEATGAAQWEADAREAGTQGRDRRASPRPAAEERHGHEPEQDTQGGVQRETPRTATEERRPAATDRPRSGRTQEPEVPRRRLAQRLAESQNAELESRPLTAEQVRVRDALLLHRRDDLRVALRARGLSTTGLKVSLAKRLARMGGRPAGSPAARGSVEELLRGSGA